MAARWDVDLADVIVPDGRAGEARPLYDQAVRLYDEKENLVEAAQVRARLAVLDT